MRQVIYQLANGQQVAANDVDHIPFLGTVVAMPDGSGRYGRVLSIGNCTDQLTDYHEEQVDEDQYPTD